MQSNNNQPSSTNKIQAKLQPIVTDTGFPSSGI